MDNTSPYARLLADSRNVKDAASEGVSEIFRTTASEEAFDRKLLQSKTIEDPQVECDRLPTTNKPVVLDEMEYGCETAITIPFGGQPVNTYMHLPVFVTTFSRIVSPRVYDDTSNLLMFKGDIEQFFYMLLLREVSDREVRSFIGTIDLACGDVNSTTSTATTETGAVAYADVGACSRETLTTIMKSMPSTYGNLAPATMLVNNITVWDIDADATTPNAGDDLASRTWLEGFKVMGTINGLELMVTMKNKVVANNDVYVLSDPAHLGRLYILKDAVLVNESRAWLMDLFLYTEIGGSLPNGGAFRKLRFAGSFAGSFDPDDYGT